MGKRASSGKNVAVHVSYTTHITSLHYIENFSSYVVSRRSRSTTPSLSGTFERSHGICDVKLGDMKSVCYESL